METLIFDTAAVLNFGHRGELTYLLKKLSERFMLLTTPGVVAEITDPNRQDLYKALISASFKVQAPTATAFDLPTLARLAQIIDPGEITVLGLAKELKATAVLDDRAARRQAADLKIQITGTLGLMAYAVQSNWTTEAECLERINHLCNASFAIPRPLPGQTLAQYLGIVQETCRPKGPKEGRRV
jgi:predicted nucleic acid-binding protein